MRRGFHSDLSNDIIKLARAFSSARADSIGKRPRYPTDLKLRAVELLKRGTKRQELAEQLGIAAQSLVLWERARSPVTPAPVRIPVTSNSAEAPVRPDTPSRGSKISLTIEIELDGLLRKWRLA